MTTATPPWLTALLRGAQSPGTVALNNGNGGADGNVVQSGTTGPVGVTGMGPEPSSPLEQISQAPPTVQAALTKLHAALSQVGQAGQEHRTSKAAAAAKHFGGRVLGFGVNPDHGEFAAVTRGGKLFHLYGDGRVVGVDHGAVARSLGVHEDQGAVAPADGPGPVHGQQVFGPDRKRRSGFAPAGRGMPGGGLLGMLGL